MSADSGVHNEFSGRADIVVQAGGVGDVYVNLPEREIPVPRQLMPPPRHFVNQRRVLSALTAVAEAPAESAPPRIAVLHGIGGVGKTSVALKWLAEHSDGFPDGQLYADLAEVGAVDGMVDDVLAGFLLDLGLDARALPASAAARAALFRSRTHGRRLQVLLDNASGAEQVEALLPGTGGSVVVVTARRELADLVVRHGARPIDLAPLEPEAARELFERLVGADRVAAEPGAVDGLLEVCAGLPIAVCVVAALAVARPRRPLARLLDSLADERRRLAQLAVDDRLSVTAVFSVSYRHLGPAAARAYRVLGVHPGQSPVGLAAVAAGMDEQLDTARAALDELVSARLVEEIEEDRYALHVLTRLHARDMAEQVDSADERAAVLDRVLRWYLRFAVRMDLGIMPGRGGWLGPEYQRRVAETAPERSVARAAMAAERANLRAAVQAAYDRGDRDGWEITWQLCEALWGLYFHGKYFADWTHTHELGVAAARQCGNPGAQARIGVQLGFSPYHQQDYQRAAELFAAAVEPSRASGSLAAEATAVESLGLARLQQGRFDEAHELLARNLRLAESIGFARRLGLAHHHLGRVLAELGQARPALDHLRTALEVLENLPVEGEPGRTWTDTYNVGRVLTSIGTALVATGQPAAADEPLRRALAIMRAENNAFEQVQVLTALGDRARALHDVAAARGHYAEALAICAAGQLPQEESLRARVAELAPAGDS